MKLFDNASKMEEKQKELEAEQLREELEQTRLELEKEKQAKLESKLDELILVGKAIFTILKQENEDRKAAYERLESQIQAATSEIISTQEKAVKVMIAYGREDNQKVAGAINEEVVNVQKAATAAQEQFLAAAEELKQSVANNTSVLSSKLGDLEESLKNMNISVAAMPVLDMPISSVSVTEEIEEIPSYVPEMEVEEDLPEMEESMTENVFAMLDEEEESGIEEILIPEDVYDEVVEEEESAILEIEEDIPDALEDGIPEDLFAMLDEEEESDIEEILIPEDMFDEVVEEEIPEDIFAVLEEEELVIPEPELVEEPASEPVVVAPVVDDPNRAMTPDEIAALIASMS